MVVWEFLDGLGYTVLSSSDVVHMNEFSVGGSLLLKYFRVVSIVRWFDCFFSILSTGIILSVIKKSPFPTIRNMT